MTGNNSQVGRLRTGGGSTYLRRTLTGIVERLHHTEFIQLGQMRTVGHSKQNLIQGGPLTIFTFHGEIQQGRRFPGGLGGRHSLRFKAIELGITSGIIEGSPFGTTLLLKNGGE
ncbi:MAG TPA: hypothetical protein PLF23_09825 [Candidatus Obscuribacter sp.]|nr:hypothetical protein [Candidatus Obscuribacter sp.]